MLDQLFDRYRGRLKRLVEIRIDGRVRSRFDASDVIQEAYAEAYDRFPAFEQDGGCSEYVWLRFLTLQKLTQLHRKHLGTQRRTVLREQRLDSAPVVNSTSMATLLMGRELTPSGIVQKLENRQLVTEALECLSELDREILAMRNFEQLTNAEAAEILQIEPDSAYRRYVRALRRLQQQLNHIQSRPRRDSV